MFAAGGAYASIAIAAALALAGCTRTEDPRLELACAVRSCECLPADPGIFRRPGGEDVLWRENGNAYCRDGYVLHLVKEE